MLKNKEERKVKKIYAKTDTKNVKYSHDKYM